jgi:hypothetical protein
LLRHLISDRAGDVAVGIVRDQRQVRLVLLQQIAGIVLRDDQDAAQQAFSQIGDSRALVVVIARQEGAGIGAHRADALQHVHRFRSAVQVDHSHVDVLDIATEGVAQNDELHQRQHQGSEQQRRTAAEFAHVALD